MFPRSAGGDSARKRRPGDIVCYISNFTSKTLFIVQPQRKWQRAWGRWSQWVLSMLLVSGNMKGTSFFFFLLKSHKGQPVYTVMHRILLIFNEKNTNDSCVRLRPSSWEKKSSHSFPCIRTIGLEDLWCPLKCTIKNERPFSLINNVVQRAANLHE